MPILRPRIAHNSDSEVVKISFSSKKIWPLTTAPRGSKAIVARAVRDFPEPLSPVIATISPGCISTETLCKISTPAIESDRSLIFKRLTFGLPECADRKDLAGRHPLNLILEQ